MKRFCKSGSKVFSGCAISDSPLQFGWPRMILGRFDFTSFCFSAIAPTKFAPQSSSDYQRSIMLPLVPPPNSFRFWRGFVDTVVARYLDCGVAEAGFARLRCQACGAEKLLRGNGQRPSAAEGRRFAAIGSPAPRAPTRSSGERREDQGVHVGSLAWLAFPSTFHPLNSSAARPLRQPSTQNTLVLRSGLGGDAMRLCDLIESNPERELSELAPRVNALNQSWVQLKIRRHYLTPVDRFEIDRIRIDVFWARSTFLKARRAPWLSHTFSTSSNRSAHKQSPP